MHRHARFGARFPATQAMPTISDVSSDNSEGGAPLYESQTFSQVKMNQAQRNRMQRDSASNGGSKHTDNDATSLHPNDSSTTVGPFPVTKQPKVDDNGKIHKLNPASDIFIPPSVTVNDLTKIQAADSQTKLLQLLEKKQQSQNGATDRQKHRARKDSFTKRANGANHAAQNHQAEKPNSYHQNGHGQHAPGAPEQPDNKADFGFSDQDVDTSAQPGTQQGSPPPPMPMPKTQTQANLAPNKMYWNNGKSTASSMALPPIPDLSTGQTQCRDIVMFQSVDEATRAGRSGLLNSIVPANGLPDETVLTHPDNCPFTTTGEDSIGAATADRGVVHIDNVPFGISRAEVIAFVGKNSRLLNDSDEPVHIIMDRVTSKTQDVYVEFAAMRDALAVVDRHENNTTNGRSSRLGDRPVRVTCSSPGRLMKALFNVARGIHWQGYVPVIKENDPADPFNNFTVFVSDEELAMLAKHAEEPRRSPFSKDARERPYECMISTIKKFPWYMTDRITLKQQYNIYACCLKLLTTLQDAIKREDCAERLNAQLLKRFTDALMLCPGFTVLQKDNIAQEVRMSEVDMCKFNMPRFADLWRHQYALGPRSGIPLDVMEYYIAIIREESTRYTMEGQELGVKLSLTKLQSQTSDYWGYFWREVGYQNVENFDNLTLRTAAQMEWTAIDTILRRALAHSQQIRQGGQAANQSHHSFFPSVAARNNKMLAY